MNQFKRAKEKSLASGQKTEKIADLRTAGIKEELKKEEKKVELPKIEKVEDPSTEKIQEQPVVITIQPEIHRNVQETKQIEVNIPDEPIAINQEMLQKDPQIVDSLQIEEINDKSEVSETFESTIEPMPEIRQVINPVVQQEHSVTEIIEPISKPIVKSIEPQLYQPQPEPAPKKKMPNIFSPKEESKSTRKSLVLKPSSVKKAENYCSKNGGSFNELVQTLLDNFIEEYGL